MIMPPITSVFVLMVLWGKHVSVCIWHSVCLFTNLKNLPPSYLRTHWPAYLSALHSTHPLTTTRKNIYLPAFPPIYIIHCQSLQLNQICLYTEPKPCLASPCMNGGTCVDRIGISCAGGVPCGNHGYECSCPIDFRGPNCEREYIWVERS